MIWTLFALFSLVVLGGFISYYGDLQGRRWGKKRVSWFGMRPKHTAILITSLTGAFISLLSIITLLAVSPVLRDVILRGERAIREYKQLDEQYHIAVTDGKKALDESQNRLAVADSQTAKKQQELADKQAQLAKLQERLLPLQQKVDDLKHRQADLQASLARKNIQYTRLNRQYSDNAKQNLALTWQNASLEKQTNALENSINELSSKDNALLATQKELTRKNAALARINEAQLGANQIQLETNAANAAKLRSQTDELNKQQQELANVTEQLDKARQEMSLAQRDLENSKGFFTVNYDQVRRGRITVRTTGELARTVIDAHLAADVIKAQLGKLLDEASKKALALGAAKGQNGRAVRIVSKRLITLSGDSYSGEEESLNALTENMIGSDKPVVVIVSAFNNTIEGEQVVVDLEPSVVVPMFESGAVLASSRLNANLSDDQVTQAIAQFLQTNVRAAVVKAGAISQVDPVSGVSQLGQFDPIDLGQLALRARQMRGDILLRAVAKTAITSADPLDRSHMRVEAVRAPASTNH